MTGLMSVVFTEFVDQKSQLTCWPFYSFIYDIISGEIPRLSKLLNSFREMLIWHQLNLF